MTDTPDLTGTQRIMSRLLDQLATAISRHDHAAVDSVIGQVAIAAGPQRANQLIDDLVAASVRRTLPEAHPSATPTQATTREVAQTRHDDDTDGM